VKGFYHKEEEDSDPEDDGVGYSSESDDDLTKELKKFYKGKANTFAHQRTQ
jgi:hypothetical protein